MTVICWLILWFSMFNVDFNTIFWLGIWYLLVAVMTGGFLYSFRLINMPCWRDDHGDISSEVGYFEDPLGRVLNDGPEGDEIFRPGDLPAPHVQAPSNSNSGLL